MIAIVCSILAFTCPLQRSIYAAAAASGPINYIFSEGSVTLDDVTTEIVDLKTIFNGKEFADSVGLSWTDSEKVQNTASELKWVMYVDGMVSSAGEEAVDNTQTLPGAISTRTGVVNKSGEHTITMEVMFKDEIITSERTYQSYGTNAFSSTTTIRHNIAKLQTPSINKSEWSKQLLHFCFIDDISSSNNGEIIAKEYCRNDIKSKRGIRGRRHNTTIQQPCRGAHKKFNNFLMVDHHSIAMIT